MNHSNIRSVVVEELAFLIDVVDRSGLFPGEMLTEMVGDNLQANGDKHWLTYVADKPIAMAYLLLNK